MFYRVLLVVGIVLFPLWGCVSSTPSLEPTPPIPSPSILYPVPQASMHPFPTPPLVNADRLWQSLQAIVALDDRYSEAGRARTRSFLREELTALGWDLEQQTFPDGENIIARKTWGTEADQPAQRWIVGAHYDTVKSTPGADDNGTGVAVLLELAHIFAEVSWDAPEPVSLELIFFDREEAGLQGSFAYSQRSENLEQLQGVIILEMIGYSCDEPGCQQYPKDLLIEKPSDRGDFLAVVGDAEHPEMLTPFSPEIQDQFVPSDLQIFTLSVPLKGVLTPDVLRSDHAPFWLQNIGAVMVTDTANLRNPHYHQTTDTL
ncbi:MAG: M28 family peptidase, partial [Prochlorotrichaceae cyanobacterium]